MPSASTGPPRPSEPLRRERIAVALAFLATGATFGTFAARLPALQARLGLPDGELGIALAGLMVGDRVIDAAGPRRAGDRRGEDRRLSRIGVGPPLVGAAAEAVGLRAAFATVPVLALAMAALAVRLPVLARAGEPDG